MARNNQQCCAVSQVLVRAHQRRDQTVALGSRFGHILRLDEDTPARLAKAKYFDGRDQTRWRGRPSTTLPTVLATDLRNAGQGNLQTKNDLELKKAGM